MKLIATVKLQPTSAQVTALRDTLTQANAVANQMSQTAWDTQTFGQYALHKWVYHHIRETTGLTAQVVVRLVAKVADAYKLDKKTRRQFRPLGSIAYDDRILRWYTDHVSIWTVAGRQHIAFICDDRARRLLSAQQGESDLIYRDGAWYLAATVNFTEPPTDTPDGYLGIDMGIVNIAVDSDGTIYSGAQLNGLRRRHARLRAKLQAKGTRAAKRVLRRRRTKERRFAAHTNHVLSKRIVRVAKDTKRGIALENLTGIRTRVAVRKPQRRTLHSWAFFQLRTFITYKAQMAGVPVVPVDPRNTSRTCPECGCLDKKNRPTQSKFLCVSCGFAGLADHIAAVVIGRRAAVIQPYSASAQADS